MANVAEPPQNISHISHIKNIKAISHTKNIRHIRNIRHITNQGRTAVVDELKVNDIPLSISHYTFAIFCPKQK